MGYPSPLTGTHQVIGDVVIANTEFSRFDTFAFGNRMALIPLSTGKLLVWSSLPSDSTVFEEAVAKSGLTEIEVAIIPDKEHTMAALGLKKKYPSIFLVGPSGISDCPDLTLDYEFQDAEANKVVEGSTVHKSLSGMDFVFFNGHANRELVMVDKQRRTLYEADLLFNIPWNGENPQQYPGKNQNAGCAGYMTRALNPDSKVGKFMFKKLLKCTPESKQGMQALMSLDFDRVVMSHGVMIDTDGKEAFKKVFSSYLK